jgi:hypothetical protein
VRRAAHKDVRTNCEQACERPVARRLAGLFCTNLDHSPAHILTFENIHFRRSELEIKRYFGACPVAGALHE